MPDFAPDCPHALLIDLLAAQDSAAGFGCGLEPRLLEVLLDRHAVREGAYRLAPPLRSEGPPQQVPQDWPHRIPRATAPEGVAHARR